MPPYPHLLLYAQLLLVCADKEPHGRSLPVWMPRTIAGTTSSQTMLELEEEVEEFGGWEKITSVRVDGKNADAEIEGELAGIRQ